MMLTRLISGLTSPLPLAGEADALAERGGWGLSPHGESRCGSTPSPTLPRIRLRPKAGFGGQERERERSADAVAARSSYAIALCCRGRREEADIEPFAAPEYQFW